MGRPIAHSRSPQLYKAGFREMGIDAVYLRLASRNIEEAVAAAKSLGLTGFNVTSPYKESIIEHLDWVEMHAALDIDAVNTVVLNDEGSIGYNTDGYGAVKALVDAGADLKKHSFLVLGAGGAARAVARELVDLSAKVKIANRTEEKARSLANELGCEGLGMGIDGDEEGEFFQVVGQADVIVSCISTLDRVVPKEALKPEHIVLDGNYSKRSALVTEAEDAGATLVDGLEWLLYQAERAFRHYTDVDGPVDAMRDAVRDYRQEYKNHNIALIGPMGSGKSAVARSIHESTGHALVDTDEEISDRLGKTIEEIFKESGEKTFREYEERVVEEVFLGRRQVVALGGGATLSEENTRRIKESAFVVLLWAPPDTLMERIKDTVDRPLLAEADDPQKELTGILDARLRNYLENSDIVIDTTNLTVDQAGELIINEVHRTFGD